MVGEDLLAGEALTRLIPEFEKCALEDWRTAEDRERYVRMLVMIRDGQPVPMTLTGPLHAQLLRATPCS